jgi:hypothetical protein
MKIPLCLFALALPLAAQTPAHTVTLAWVASSVVAPFVAPSNYNVKRSPVPGGAYTIIATVPNLSYIDTITGPGSIPEGATACYIVTAVRADGSETGPNVNGEVCVVIPFSVQPVATPGKLTATPR